MANGVDGIPIPSTKAQIRRLQEYIRVPYRTGCIPLCHLNTVRGDYQIESTLLSSVELFSAVQIGFTDFCVKK